MVQIDLSAKRWRYGVCGAVLSLEGKGEAYRGALGGRIGYEILEDST